MNKYHKYSPSIRKKTSSLKNYSKSSSKIIKLIKIKLIISKQNRLSMPLKLSKFWEKTIGGNLDSPSMESSLNNIKNNTATLKMLYSKTQKKDSALSKEKWITLMISLEKYYLKNGAWIAFSSTNSVQSLESTSPKFWKELLLASALPS